MKEKGKEERIRSRGGKCKVREGRRNGVVNCAIAVNCLSAISTTRRLKVVLPMRIVAGIT